MTKTCFNCQKLILKPEEGICPHCGVKFDLIYFWDNDLQNICDLAVAYKRNGQFKEAIEIYEKLNIDYPNNPVIYKAWAKTLTVSGDYNKGLKYFKKAKELYEFFDNPTGKQSIYDCDRFISVLSTAKRDSQKFKVFLQAIAGNLTYSIDPETINDNMDVGRDLEEENL